MGKSSAPPPPDYAAAAQATAQGNLEAAQQQTEANRVNQQTPYGSLTYSNTPVVNQSGYDAAMKSYQDQLEALKNKGGTFGALAMARLQAPNINDYTNKNNWTATQSLSPDQQKILEQNTSLTQGLLGTAQTGLGKVDELLANPTIDESKLAQMPIQGQSVQDAIFARLQPQMDRRREQVESQLANQGITRGSEAFNNAMNDQSQQENDLRTQAALQGINTGLTARQQGMQEQAYMQDRPLNVVNALRTGNQVQGPTFVNPAQQAYAPGADLLGATNQQYGAAVGDVNAKNAASAKNAQAATSLAVAAMML